MAVALVCVEAASIVMVLQQHSQDAPCNRLLLEFPTQAGFGDTWFVHMPHMQAAWAAHAGA